MRKKQGYNVIKAMDNRKRWHDDEKGNYEVLSLYAHLVICREVSYYNYKVTKDYNKNDFGGLCHQWP